MGSRSRAQSSSSVNKTSQWQLACVFRNAHHAPQRGYKRRARANAHQFFRWGAETVCPGRTAVVQQLWRRDVTSPFPPSGNEGYTCNRDVPYQSVTFDVTSEWLTNGIPLEKRHYCWPPPVPCGSRQVPPHQLGRKIGQDLGRDDRHCCSVQWVWITLGKRTPSRGTLRKPHPA